MNSNVTVLSCIPIPNSVTQSVTQGYNKKDANNYTKSNNNYAKNIS